MLGLIATLPLLFAQAPTSGGGTATPSPAATAAPSATAGPATPATAPASPAANASPVKTAPAPGAVSAPGAPAAPAQPGSSNMMFVLPGILLLFYLLILRPQNQQEKKRKAMINNVGKNTRVMTTGGIYGTVVSVDSEHETVFLRIGSDPGVKVEFARSAILRVVEAAEKDKA